MEPEKRKGPGRPKKKQQMAKEEYKGIIKAAETPEAMFEVILTEPCTLLQYLQTLKSNDTASMKILITPERMIFKAVIEAKPKSIPDANKKPNNKTMFINIEGAEVYSYYCEEPIQIEISSVSTLDSIIEYSDQYSENIKLYILRRSSNSLNYEIFNRHLSVTVKSHVKAQITHPIADVVVEDYSPQFDYSDTRIEFLQYVAEHFKKLLIKKSTKNANRFNINAKHQFMRIEITTAEGITDTLEFNVTKNANIKICRPNELYSAHFPKSDVFAFITHIKSRINIHMNSDQLLITHSELGMSITSVVDLAN